MSARSNRAPIAWRRMSVKNRIQRIVETLPATAEGGWYTAYYVAGKLSIPAWTAVEHLRAAVHAGRVTASPNLTVRNLGSSRRLFRRAGVR